MADSAVPPEPESPQLSTVEQWRTFLTSYSADVLRAAESYEWCDVTEDQLAAGWLGFEGASEQQLAAVERRLGMRLPPSYRAFLGASDGWWHLGPFMYEMRTTETVGWLRDTEPTFWKMLHSHGGDEAAFMDRVLLVSAVGDAQYWLLDPGEVSPAGEWTAYTWASWHPGLSMPSASFGQLVIDQRRSFEELSDEHEYTYDPSSRAGGPKAPR
ncbi:SMI1/KNR4 family protein [Streptomyces sp. NBC_01304]|uniref:SMI1/KNR4 family protein n=1 Tax=Streptomyces sp. NBC_01304 TaxID=2903818 RepID=UPI002E12D33D|nr:SMI1/KNR4 family protein [Streptomyces sp. NBC_01304]